MKTKILFAVFLGLLNSHTFSQEPNKTNYVQGKINVPIVVDRIETEDHFLDDRRDSNTKYENEIFDISTQLKYIPIYFWGKGTFKGVYKEEIYDLVTEINISGRIDFKTNLGVVNIQQTETKNAKSGVCDYDYKYSYNYEYKNLKVSTVLPIGSKEKDKTTSYFFKPNENTKLTLINYIYTEDTKCPKRNFTKNLIFKNINEEYLKEKLSSHWSYFSFNVNWNGKTIDDLIKEDVKITKVRDEDLNWVPPCISYLSEGTETEPNSVGIYYEVSGIKDSDVISKGMAALLTANLAKVSELKILERGHINKIKEEFELSESGLVKEDSKVLNNLMKEEIAVIVNVDVEKKQVKANVVSKNKEILIEGKYLETIYVFNFQNLLDKIIIDEINEQFNMNVNPKVIFN